MKKTFLFAVVCLAFIGMMSCSGNKEKRVQTFAETISGYVNANQLDSIKAVYPTAKFDSIAPLASDSIQITEKEGAYRIDFGGSKWIVVKENEDGTFTVENSKGIAAFPQDKYEIAVNTGMLNDSITDSKIQELLNDSAYFAWLNEQAKNSYDNALSLKGGKVKMGVFYGEGVRGLKLPVEITNNLPIKISAQDYKINYTLVGAGEQSTNWRPSYFSRSISGKDIDPGQTINVEISDRGAGLANPIVKLKMPMEEYLEKYYKPTGKEYQEYLDSKK